MGENDKSKSKLLRRLAKLESHDTAELSSSQVDERARLQKWKGETASRFNGRSVVKYKSLHQNGTTVIHQNVHPPYFDLTPKPSQYGSIYDKDIEDSENPSNKIKDATKWKGHGCCYSHHAPGCDTRAIQDCVCSIDDSCCSSTWDETCVAQIAKLNCGTCSTADRIAPPVNETVTSVPEPIEDTVVKEPDAAPLEEEAATSIMDFNHTRAEFQPSAATKTRSAAAMHKTVKAALKKHGPNTIGQDGGNRRPIVANIPPLVPDNTAEEVQRMRETAKRALKRLRAM